MEIVFDRKNLFHLLRDFHTITGLRVGVYDRACREVAAFPVRQSGFCKLIRARPEALANCLRCDREAFARAQEEAAPYTYQCHAGLTETVAPIRGGDAVLGYLMIGQMRRIHAPQGQWEALQGSFAALGMDVAYLESAFYALPALEDERIQACARILAACAVSVLTGGGVRLQREELPARVMAYLRDHLEEPVTLEGLSQVFGVGRTTLCTAFRREFGRPVGDMLRALRVERAQELLSRTDLPVAQVAEACGIGDYNYFARVFRAATGQSPSAWRRRAH